MEKQGDSHFYIRASVGRGREVIIELEKRGGRNLNAYRGEGDKTTLYYIGRENIIQVTHDFDEIGYVLVNSGWTELKLKEHKRERLFVISVKEGSDHCKKCHLYGKCDDTQEKKCEIASLLKTDKELDGKTLAIKEIDPEDVPYHVYEEIKQK